MKATGNWDPMQRVNSQILFYPPHENRKTGEAGNLGRMKDGTYKMSMSLTSAEVIIYFSGGAAPKSSHAFNQLQILPCF